jgi:chemotaxis signal transduction protein
LPLEHLLACLPLKGVTPVPKARPEIVGVTRWEGKVVAVFSLATLLGQKGWFHDPSVLLMLRYGGSAFGLDCEETPRSLLLPRESLAAEPRGAQRTVTLPAAGPLSGRTLQWIDPDRLLDFPQQP